MFSGCFFSEKEDGILTLGSLSVYRRARKVVKESVEETRVETSFSYYEIFKDQIFDLFEGPEKRSLVGLPLRDNGTKAVVVGLTERPCESLKDFERLYDQANMNRSTSATKVSNCFAERGNDSTEEIKAQRSLFAVTRYSRNKALSNSRRSNKNQYGVCY